VPDNLVSRLYRFVTSAGYVRVCACNRLVQDCVEGHLRAGLRQGRRCMELCPLYSPASVRASVQSCGSTRCSQRSAVVPSHGMQMPTCIIVLFITFEGSEIRPPLVIDTQLGQHQMSHFTQKCNNGNDNSQARLRCTNTPALTHTPIASAF